MRAPPPQTAPITSYQRSWQQSYPSLVPGSGPTACSLPPTVSLGWGIPRRRWYRRCWRLGDRLLLLRPRHRRQGLLLHRPRVPALPRCSTVRLLGRHVTFELLAAQHEVTRLVAVVADTLATLLLPAATAATSTATPWALGAGAIHRTQLHGYVLAAAVAMGTHTAWCLPASASHTFSHQSCTFEVLWVCYQDLAADVSSQAHQEAIQHLHGCCITNVQQCPPESINIGTYCASPLGTSPPHIPGTPGCINGRELCPQQLLQMSPRQAHFVGGSNSLPPDGSLPSQPQNGHNCPLHIIVKTCETKVQVAAIQKGLQSCWVFDLTIEELWRRGFNAGGQTACPSTPSSSSLHPSTKAFNTA